MTTPLANQPAFPHIADVKVVHTDGTVTFRPVTSGGQTLRQHFAAMAMQGLLSSGAVFGPKEFNDDSRRALLAKVAVMEADALIAALEEKK